MQSIITSVLKVITHRCRVEQSHEIVEGKMSFTCFVDISVPDLVHSFVEQ